MHDVLGYSQSDSKLFHKNVVSAIMGKQPSKTEKTQFGTKHTYHVSLIGKDGKAHSANVVVVIQKDNGRVTHKIVTVGFIRRFHHYHLATLAHILHVNADYGGLLNNSLLKQKSGAGQASLRELIFNQRCDHIVPRRRSSVNCAISDVL